MARLLVVDDEPGICEALQEFFEGEGFETFTALDGPTALEIIKRERPHVVLLDIVMPGMDGLEVLEEARAIDPKVGIIMVTAVHDEPLAKKALAMGANDYITKPLDLNYLRMSVLTKVLDLIG
ncbi:MAG: response regulator [Nitrospinota bacterium]